MTDYAARFIAALALAGVTACTGNRPPVVTPTPPPPEPQCAEGQTTCCWHQPPGNEWLYACPAPSVPGGVLNVAGGPAQCPGASCGGTEPPPVDPPPTGDVPPKGQAVGSDKLLRIKSGLRGLRTNGGVDFVPFGAEPCCDSWAKCPDTQGAPLGIGWPGFSACFVEQMRKYGANLFHFRVGPWFATDEYESLWKPVGNAYAEDGSWNAAFWAKLRELVWLAYKQGAYVEVVPVDDWWLKGACGKDASCGKRVPWSEAAVRAWGKQPHPEAEALYRKTVEEVGCFGNVIWATGNEEDLIPGVTSEHLEWRVQVLRDAEKKVGCNFVHLIGTGSTKDGISADFQITHENAPVDGPCNGRYCANNEHNPAVSVEEEADRFKKALDSGQRYDAWRADANDADWEKRLQAFQGVLSGTVAPQCFAPPQEPEEMWQTLGPGPGDRNDEIREGQAALGSLCKEPKAHSNGDEAIEALAAQMRKMGFCASKHSDSVTIQSEEDPAIWLEYHAVAPYDTGCWSQRSQDYPQNRHLYLGNAPEPPTSSECPVEVPTVDEVFCKLHQPGQGLWDCTPKYRGQPIRPEGDPMRPACEVKAMGGVPTYTLEQATGITMEPVENPMQFRIFGSGSGIVKCTVPAVSGNVCAGGGHPDGVPVSR